MKKLNILLWWYTNHPEILKRKLKAELIGFINPPFVFAVELFRIENTTETGKIWR